MSIPSQRAMARLFGLTVDGEPAQPGATGYEWHGGVPFAATDTPTPQPDDGETPEFDGGARDTASAPADPEHDHGQLIADLLREGEGF